MTPTFPHNCSMEGRLSQFNKDMSNADNAMTERTHPLCWIHARMAAINCPSTEARRGWSTIFVLLMLAKMLVLTQGQQPCSPNNTPPGQVCQHNEPMPLLNKWAPTAGRGGSRHHVDPQVTPLISATVARMREVNDSEAAGRSYFDCIYWKTVNNHDQSRLMKLKHFLSVTEIFVDTCKTIKISATC